MRGTEKRKFGFPTYLCARFSESPKVAQVAVKELMKDKREMK